MVSRVPILAYHAIVEDDRAQLPRHWSPFHAVPLRVFRAQLDLLAAAGCNTVAPEDLERTALPPGSVAITFDDGHSSDLIAARELRRRGLQATFFVNWSRLERAGFLNCRQVVELERQGFGIGSHGLTHVGFAGLTPDEVRRELAGSKERLERLLGKPVTGLAVPYGSYNSQVVASTIAAGYHLMMTSDYGLAVAGSYLLARLTVHSGTTLRDFRELVAGSWIGIARQHLTISLSRRMPRLWPSAGLRLQGQ
jgi:peptidoglycan/xylan/chitin deacetylase (PgdA/CDA1 family)